MYDPTIGRWISEDPIGFAGGDPNLYRYVGNSPTNATDPSGLVAFENKSGKPKSIYDDIWKKDQASYKSRPVDLLTMHHLIAPIQTLTQEAIATGWTSGLKVFADFLRHYAANTGAPKNVNMADFLGRDQKAWDTANGLIRDAANYADKNWKQINGSGGKFRSEMIYTEAEEFEYARVLLHYGAWIEGNNISCKNGVMRMNLTYQIDDVYDYDITSKGGVGLPWKKILRLADLAAMHEFGQMRAYRVGGAIGLTATWKSGDLSTLMVGGMPARPANSGGGGPY